MSASHVRRVGIVFSGGPAPAANSVIAAAANAFLSDGSEVVGFFHGYSSLELYDPVAHPLVANEDYRFITEGDTSGLRNARGILIGTARAHPGRPVVRAADLADPKKTERLSRVIAGLRSLGIEALISIGGDGTLKTANLIYEFQMREGVPEAQRVRVVHVPKTIDNDYNGIDFTFGFFTAVDFMAKSLLNLKADAIATSSYYVVETMGRSAGWVAYGVAIAGEANLVVGVEDIDESLSMNEATEDGRTERKLDVAKLVDRIVDLILQREEKRRQHYGTIVVAEGLGALLPKAFLPDGTEPVSLPKLEFGKLIAKLVAERYAERTGEKKKVTGIQLGYEARCAEPHAFDVVLGSQLGVRAYRALVEARLDGHMVSVEGQLNLRYVPFSKLIDPETLFTETRFINRKSDFHKLAHFLERRADRSWAPRRRRYERKDS